MAITDLIPWRTPRSVGWREDDPVTSMQREMSRMLQDFWNDGGQRMGMPLRAMPSTTTFFPNLEICEVDGAIDMTAEIPGIDEKDIKLTLSDDGETLTLEGEKKHEEETKSGEFYRAERTYGKFRRSVRLPAQVAMDKVEAKCKDGVLTVHLPKVPEKEQHVKQIPVKAG